MVPAATRGPVTVLSRADVLRLLDATRDTRLGALWNLLAYTGMRPGEALGLRWDEVNLDAGRVRIQRALVPQKKDPATGRTWRLEEPKTEQSRRAIPLLPATVDALKWHRTRQQAEKIAAAGAYADHGFVFASPAGEPLREDVVYTQLRRAIGGVNAEATRQAEAEGTKPILLPAVTLYALRHTAATLMLEAGIALKVVQERLGHSTMMLTADTYSHVSASLQARAIEDLARYMAAMA